LFFGLGTLLYLLRCPRIIADHTDVADFLRSGKGWVQLSEYASDIGLSPVSRVGYTGMSIGLGPQVEGPEATCFWDIYREALRVRPVALTSAAALYAFGFALIGWVLGENFVYVARFLLGFVP